MERKLKIGFVIDASHQVPAWYAETLNRVLLQQHILYFIEIPERKKTTPPFFFRAFRSFERWWFRSAPDASKKQSIEELISKTALIRIHPITGLLLEQTQIQPLIDLGLDLIYTVEADIDSGNLSEAARYGLWYINFGKDKNGQDTAGLHEVLENDPVTTSQLVMRKNNKETVLYNGSTQTIPFSARNNFNSIAWKASSYLPYRLNEIYSSNFPGNRPVLTERKKFLYPSNFRMPWLFLRNIVRYLSGKFRKRKTRDRFTLLYSREDFTPHLSGLSFQPLSLPAGEFYADPFVMHHNGKAWIFFEAYDYQKGKAHISVMEMNEEGNLSAPEKVLEENFHLSYPFVFANEGQFYMVPETASNKTVSLYRAVNFPYEWELVMHLMEGREWFDSTLHYENGKWWLFANGRDHPFVSTNDQLFLYYSDNLFSTNWVPHIQNPIATRIENCRPAGRLFRHEGRLYRPAQDNASFQYGYGIRLNAIEILNENFYSEKEVFTIKADSLELKATHHLEITKGLVFIDGIVKAENRAGN